MPLENAHSISPAHSRSPSPTSQFRTSSPSPDYVEVHLPTTSTRRPPPNTHHSIPSPVPIYTPAPDYYTLGPPNIILTNQPPAITEDNPPPWYTQGIDTQDIDNTSPAPLFLAIFQDNPEQLTTLITHNPSLVNTKDHTNRTPLYCAVVAYKHRIDIVKLLLEAGASVNEWSSERLSLGHDEYTLTDRTALMAACTLNRLAIARLLLAPPYNADAKLVAPDGQHALRLASAAGAREIVQLLPSYRAGGWARVKQRSRPQIRKIKKTAMKMYKVGKVLVWHIPRFFLWTVPKYIVKLVWRLLEKMGKEAWWVVKTTGEGLAKLPKAMCDLARWLPGAVMRGAKKTPGALKMLLRGVWRVVVVIAKWVWDLVTVQVPEAARWTWLFSTVTVPHAFAEMADFLWRVVVHLVKWVWKVLTVRLPKVSVMVYTAIIAGTKKSLEWLVNAMSAVASLLHTCVSFLLRQCTWSNVVAGIKTILEFVFVDVPVALWNGAKATYKVMFKVVEGLFGGVGWLIWKLGECLVAAAMWFPAMMGKILMSIGTMFGHVWKEIRVWMNPKAEV